MAFGIFITRYSEQRLLTVRSLKADLVYHKYPTCKLLNSHHPRFGPNSGYVCLSYEDIEEMEAYFLSKGFIPNPCPICGLTDSSPASDATLMEMFNRMEEQDRNETPEERIAWENEQDAFNQELINRFFNCEKI